MELKHLYPTNYKIKMSAGELAFLTLKALAGGIIALASPNLGATITINPSAGFSITWDGNNGDFEGLAVPDNWALEGTPGATSEYGVTIDPDLPYHEIPDLNDGSYGNQNSWIGAEGSDPAPAAWVILAQEIEMTSFAFGRDNGKSRTGTEPFTDRYAGSYLISITTSGGSNWTEVGTITLSAENSDTYTGWLRHEFQISATGGAPVLANGIRIQTVPGIAIDEIEVYGIPEPRYLGAVLALGALCIGLRKKLRFP
jgi:hypothetical protein